MGSDILIVSDLDNTLTGDDDALAEFAKWIAGRRDTLKLVYSSGRFFESIADLVESTLLPEPDAVICGVGTEIREFPSGAPLSDWGERLADWPSDEVRAIADQFDELTPQPLGLQSERKVSYFSHQASDDLLERIVEGLSLKGIDVTVVYSSQRDLDLLPPGVDKGAAADFLADHWNIPNDCVIACGDSGNDAAMLRRDFWGVVVENAHCELKELRTDNVYHSTKPFAGGVLDGIEYWLESKFNGQAAESTLHRR